MTDTTSSDPPRGPILLCAGTDAAALMLAACAGPETNNVATTDLNQPADVEISSALRR